VRSAHTRATDVLQSFGFAFGGVAAAWRQERNFRIQVLYGIAVGLCLAWFQPPLVLTILSLLSVVLLLSAELANSALERVVDMISPESHPLAGAAKDMAAAAVMLLSFASAAIVFVALMPFCQKVDLFGLGGALLWMMMLTSRFAGEKSCE